MVDSGIQVMKDANLKVPLESRNDAVLVGTIYLGMPES
jgi:hypothetical protein